MSTSMRAEDVNLSPMSFWEAPPEERERAFALLREERPISWHEAPENPLMPDGFATKGFWALVRYDDVRTVSRDPATFCSGRGVMHGEAPQELLDATQSILAMDHPRHTKVRGLIGKGFAPRQIRQIEDAIRANARQVVDDLGDGAEGDFVERVSKRLPLMTIMNMLGVPEEDHERLVTAADELVSAVDPEVARGREVFQVVAEAIGILHEAVGKIAAQRRADPGDDLVSALVTAEVDGERLTDFEVAAFFVLLSVAGNDTTRHTTSIAMRALCENPDQRAIVQGDPEGTLPVAVEEFVRWASPVMNFRRTTTRDTELSGQAIAEGENVVMFYGSANRDPRAFADPDRFDVTRDPNHHAGFGGGGPHYCLGASLARTQLRALFGELLPRFPELTVGEPDYLLGGFVRGVGRMSMHTGPRAG